MFRLRDIAIYLVRRLCCTTLPNVDAEFSINNYSTVSSVVQRVKRRHEEDKTLLEERGFLWLISFWIIVKYMGNRI